MRILGRILAGLMFLGMVSPMVMAEESNPVPPGELVKNFYPPKDNYDKTFPRLFLDRKDRERIVASRFPEVERKKIKVSKKKKRVIRHVCVNVVIDLKTGKKICIR